MQSSALLNCCFLRDVNPFREVCDRLCLLSTMACAATGSFQNKDYLQQAGNAKGGLDVPETAPILVQMYHSSSLAQTEVKG